MGIRMTTHPLEIPVNHVAGVEVIEAIGDTGQLGGASALPDGREEEH